MKTINEYWNIIKKIDNDFILVESGRSFSIEKTRDGITGSIYFTIIDPPRYSRSQELSGDGFLVRTSKRHSSDRRRGQKRFLENNLDRFNEFAQEFVNDVNESINDELENKLTRCYCPVRNKAMGAQHDKNWKKVLSELDLPYYKPNGTFGMYSYQTEFGLGIPQMTIDRKHETLNHTELDVNVERLQHHEILEILDIMKQHLGSVREFTWSHNSAFDYWLRVKEIKISTLKKVIDVFRKDLVYRKDEAMAN